MKTDRTLKLIKKPANSRRSAGCAASACSVLEFKLDAGGKIYEGAMTVPDGPGPCTLPMMINALMVNLARDCPQLHDATECRFTGKLVSKPND